MKDAGSGAERTAWWPRAYQSSWWRSDILAGLTAAAVVIPQAMAYAVIAGLPVEVGLYTASVPMAAYALAGSSRALSVSTTSSIAAVTAVAVTGSDDPVGVAQVIALFAGTFLVLAGICRLGYVADLISVPVLTGFKVGVGISIAVGQLHSLLGVDKQGDRLVTQLWSAITSIPRASVTTMALSLACIIALVALKRWLPAVPGPLVVVVLAIVTTVVFHLPDHGIALVGTVPSGFPVPALPPVLDHLDLVGAGLGVALIAFVESISAARAFQAEDDRPVSADRELRALGLANFVSSLIRGMPAGGGMSQTAVANGAGARSPMTGVVAALTTVVALLFLAPVFSNLPEATLGALVLVAALGLVDNAKIRRIYAADRRDGILALLAALGVAAMGALDGILIAVLISVLTLLYETSRRPVEVVDLVAPQPIPLVPVPHGLLVLRPASEIYFANVQHLRRDVLAAVEESPTPPRVVLFDGTGVSIFEYSAHQALRQLVEDLEAQGIAVWEAERPGEAAAAAARYRAAHGQTAIRQFPTAEAAVAAYIAEFAPNER